jgi:hypothetical protein
MILLGGAFIFLGTFLFLFLVAQAVAGQRRALEWEKWHNEEARQCEEKSLPVAQAMKIDA